MKYCICINKHNFLSHIKFLSSFNHFCTIFHGQFSFFLNCNYLASASSLDNYWNWPCMGVNQADWLLFKWPLPPVGWSLFGWRQGAHIRSRNRSLHHCIEFWRKEELSNIGSKSKWRKTHVNVHTSSFSHNPALSFLRKVSVVEEK